MQVDARAEALRTGRALGNARPVALTAGRIALAECPALMVRAGLRLVCENHISFLSAAFPLCSRPFFELNGAKGGGVFAPLHGLAGGAGAGGKAMPYVHAAHAGCTHAASHAAALGIFLG